MICSLKLSDFNFILDYKKLFSYKLLVVFGYIALIFNLLIQFFTNIITNWTGQLFEMLFINFLGIFFVFIFLMVYILLFGFIIVDLTLLFSKKNREENTKEEKKNSIIFLVLNLLISLYALWYLGFNILLILFLVALIFLIKYLISQEIEKRGIFIRLGILLIFLLLMCSGIVAGIIFDKGQWTTKYLFNNKNIEKVNISNKDDEVLFITKSKDFRSGEFNQKLYVYDIEKKIFTQIKSININESCELYNDEYIYNFKSGYRYSLSEDKKTKIKRKKKLNVQKAIALDNGNFILMGTEERPKILWKYNPKARYFQSKETFKMYLYITKYDYYVQLKSYIPVLTEEKQYNALKLKNGNILFWGLKDGLAEIYETTK